MPVFATCAAYAVIDTMLLLMWHQAFFSRMSQDSLSLPHLRRLIDYYLGQCQPAPRPLHNASFLRRAQIAISFSTENEDIA